MDPALRQLARRACLQNALQHGGRCNPKGLVGRVLGAHAEFRARAAEVMAALEAEGEAVNAMSPQAQMEALAAEGPAGEPAAKKERRTGLRELSAVSGRVVMRFAPNPNGPLSFGHSRGVSILSEYWRMYGAGGELAEASGGQAELLLRFDDTDPQVKPPLWDPARGWDGYQMIRDDFEWLTGRKPSREVVASDRIAIYQQAARDLIQAGGAYVCPCEADAFRALKAKGEPCPHRELPIPANLEAFRQMVEGEAAKGSMVLRVKTDIRHRDPALRDWTAFRVVATDAIHPRERTGHIPRHHAWPLLDFQSAIEDHLQGVTHVIRGKDLMDSTRKQGYLYQHMGWTYPQTLYWGRVSVHEFGKFSTSMMRRAIEAGKFTGWDDPRLPTLAALRRRGYSPQAVRRFWVGLGLTEKDIAVSMANLEAEDQKAIDDATPRYFFVPSPQALKVEGLHGRSALIPIHPGHPERGQRTLEADGDVWIPSSEATAAALRLKDLGNVRLEGAQASFTGTVLDRSMPIIQWLPKGHAAPFTVLRPEYLEATEEVPAGDDGPPEAKGEIEVPELHEVKGLAEPAATQLVGKVVQFERFGFVRIESPHLGIWLHG